ncbi:MAG: FlgD immunoglobulin-like domain containing protein [bacterium]
MNKSCKILSGICLCLIFIILLFLTRNLQAQTFYDDCGNPSIQPHLIQGISYNKWTNIDPGATEAQRSVNYHPERVIYSYTGLDPSKDYRVRITYLQESGDRRIQRLEAKDLVIHGDLSIPEYSPAQFTFMLPKASYNDGRLLLNFIKGVGPNAVVSEILIEEANPGGLIKGIVFDQNNPEQRLAGVKITIAGIDTYSDNSGNYSFDRLPAGEYTIRAEFTGFDRFESSINLTTSDVTLDIGMSASTFGHLEGVVTDQIDTTKLLGVLINLSPIAVASSDAKARSTLSDNNGHFIFSSLPTGTYQLEAEIDGYESFNQNITIIEGANTNDFSMTQAGSPYFEQEPNNECVQPNQIEIGLPVIGFISVIGDNDYFKLEISRPGHMTIVFSSVPPNLELVSTVLDSGCQEIASVTGAEGSDFYLETDIQYPGTYYIRVNDEGNDEASYASYVFKISLTSGDQFEPNNVPKESFMLDIGENYFPTIFPLGDTDYFCFYIADSGNLTLSLLNVPANLALRFILYKADLSEIWQRSLSVGATFSENIALMDTGIYYLKIDDVNTQQSLENYHFILKFIPGTDELEPNNSFANASVLLLDKPLRASIYPQGDLDFFYINLESEGSLSITIQQVPASIRHNVWIFNEQKELITTTYANGAGVALSFSVMINAPGKYYIKLGDYNNLNSSIERYLLSASFDQIWFDDFTHSAAFSPNSDGQSDTCTIHTAISHHYPIDHWNLTIRDSSDTIVRSFTGTGEDVTIVWDGHNNANQPLTDGDYNYRLEVWDSEGNFIISDPGIINIDKIYPVASITEPIQNEYLQDSVNIIGTALDDNFSNYTLSYGQGVNPSEWHQLIVSQNQRNEASLYNWNISGEPDGVYTLQLDARDKAGNFTTVTRTIEIDQVIFSNVTIHPKDFNPTNGETTTLYFDLDKQMEVSVSILAPDNSLIKNILIDSLLIPGSHSISWDGRTESGEVVSDEAYHFELQAQYPGSDHVKMYEFESSDVPYINNIVGCEDFNPAINESCTISYNITANAKVTLKLGVSGVITALRTLLNGIPRKKGVNFELWDGRNDNGDLIDAGDYLIAGWVSALNDNEVITTGNLLLIESLNVLPPVITPSFGEICTIQYEITKDAAMSIIIQDPDGVTVKTLADSISQEAGEHSFIWDGKDEDGNVVCLPGVYYLPCKIKLTAEGAGGLSVTAYANIHIANQ